MGWEFPFEWLIDLGTGCPPISSSLANINFPQLQGCYLSYGWLEFLQQHAVSVSAALHTLLPGASPQTTETQKPRSLMEGTHIGIQHGISLAVFFFFLKGLNYIKKKVSEKFRTLQGIWPIRLREQGKLRDTGLLTMSDSFILMVILLTASVALLNILRRPAPLSVWVPTARGSYKTKKAGWHVICCPYFRFRRISIHQMVCPKLAKQITWTVDCCFQKQLGTSVTSTYRKKKKNQRTMWKKKKSKDYVKQN